MWDPSSLHESISDHGDGVLSFLTSQLVAVVYSRHLLGPLGLVSAMGLRLRDN